MTYRLITIFFMIILCVISTGCSRYVISPSHIKLPQYGSYELLTGMRQGCNSAHSSRGNGFYRTFFKLELDAKQIENAEYFDAWYRGYINCFHIITRRAFDSIDSNVEPAHAFFWNRGNPGNPKLNMQMDGFHMGSTGQGVKLPGEGEGWWNTHLLGGCKGILQCSN